jgi:hypothetical protein
MFVVPAKAGTQFETSRRRELPRRLPAAFERYHRAGLWSRMTAVSQAGFERLAHSLHAGGFITRRATYGECVRDFGRSA